MPFLRKDEECLKISLHCVFRLEFTCQMRCQEIWFLLRILIKLGTTVVCSIYGLLQRKYSIMSFFVTALTFIFCFYLYLYCEEI